MLLSMLKASGASCTHPLNRNMVGKVPKSSNDKCLVWDAFTGQVNICIMSDKMKTFQMRQTTTFSGVIWDRKRQLKHTVSEAERKESSVNEITGGIVGSTRAFVTRT